MLGFEPRALSAQPDETSLRRFRRMLERTTGIPALAARRRLIVDTIIRVALSVGLIAPVILVSWVPVVTAGVPIAAAVILFAILGSIAGLGIWLLLRPIPRRWRALQPWRRWFRLTAFAADNGLAFSPEREVRQAGLMFHQGKHRRILDSFITPDSSFEIGTFVFTPVDSGSSTRDPAYGFLRIRLPRSVPHLVLLSVARRDLRGYSSVGLAFAESQRVRLEGDFDRFFTVYAPDGYGADARYLLTPDFMARLADHAAAFDLEFIDDQLFVYSAAGFDVGKFATWAWARWFAEIVGVAALRRTGRFSDDRSAAPGFAVAPQGRRLKVGVPLVAGLMTATVIVVQVLRVILQSVQ